MSPIESKGIRDHRVTCQRDDLVLATRANTYHGTQCCKRNKI